MAHCDKLTEEMTYCLAIHNFFKTKIRLCNTLNDISVTIVYEFTL